MRLLLLLLLLVAPATSRAETPAPATAPAKPRLLVLDLKANGVAPDVVSTIQGVIAAAVGDTAAFDVLTGEDVRRLIELEGMKQTAGCDADSSCLAEIAGALGARFVVFGDAGRLGDVVIVNLSLFEVERAASVNRQSLRAEKVEALADVVEDGVFELVAPKLPPGRKAELLAAARARRAARTTTTTTTEPAPSTVKLEGPHGPPLFVVDPQVVKMSPSVAATVSSSIAQTAQAEGLSVFTKADAREVLGRAADLQLLGSDADQVSLAELGRVVGVPHVVATVVSEIDGDIVVQMRLIDTARAAVITRREARSSQNDGSLLKTVETATQLVLAPIFGKLKGNLAVTVSEEGANVLVDDVQIGVSPVQSLTLPGGHHLLTITKDGFVRHQETVRIEQGKTATRAVTLRPSLEFLQKYRAENGLYRTLAWTTTSAAVPLALAGAGLGVAWAYQNGGSGRVKAFWQKRIDDEGLTEFDPEFDQGEQEIQDSENRAGQFGFGAASVGGLAVAVGAVAAWFWVFGDDPERYVGFENEMAATGPAR